MDDIFNFETVAKVALLIEYDGGRYHGSQYQINASTIQGEIEQAVYKFTGEKIRIYAASRTDAGVHARGQVVSLRTNKSFPTETWIKALNFHLPSDISVRDAYKVDIDFDVRRQALSREYRYYIWNSLTRSPLRQDYSYFVPQPLDIDSMNKAAQVLIGEHDFAPFTPTTMKQTWRQVYKAEVSRRNDLVIFDMQANSFLAHQVRNTIGGLIQVGLGKIGVEDFWGLARSERSGVVGPTAPSNGLFLMNINYVNFPPSIERKEVVEVAQQSICC